MTRRCSPPAAWVHVPHATCSSEYSCRCDEQGESPDRISAVLSERPFRERKPVERTIVELAGQMLESRIGPCRDITGGRSNVFAPIFHCVSVPDVSASSYLRDYLLAHGLSEKQHLSDVVLQHAIELIGRMIHKHGPAGFHLCSSNIHRVLLSTVMISAKLLDDEPYNNHHWSVVGGVSLQHLNELELYTLDLLNFTLLPIGVVGDMSCLESA